MALCCSFAQYVLTLDYLPGTLKVNVALWKAIQIHSSAVPSNDASLAPN